MAFMGRGDRPSVGNNIGGRNGNDYHIEPYYRRIYYIPLDNTYVIMQMIVTFIILIVGAITFLVTYKSNVADPIEDTKKLFMNAHLISIVFFLIINLVINLCSKKESDLIKRLLAVTSICIISMLVFLGVKLNLDTTYNRVKFEQLYTEQNTLEYTSQKDRIHIGISDMSIKSEKEYFIDEYMKTYNIFKIKSYGTLGLHFLLNVLLIYQILKIQKKQNKKEKVNKDDLILFDEEQNVKF